MPFCAPAIQTRIPVLSPTSALALAALQTKLEVPYDSLEHLEAGKMVVQLLQDLTLPPDLENLEWDTMTVSPSMLTQVSSCIDRGFWALFCERSMQQRACKDAQASFLCLIQNFFNKTI